ncbi:acyltransferase [uncultured Sphaerotilus sp.]|uniref:acyltransferase family protein n=1 Tax=uncultured Sphaerotilus sp. TaxID=474984 RepID=UPI0030CA2C38
MKSDIDQPPRGAQVREALPAPPRPSVLLNALQQPRLAGLDVLRAFAVLVVIINHLGVDQFGPVVVFDGSLGVELFFILSGFLITWLLLGEHERHGRIALGPFYQRRLARLLPASLAYLLVGMGLLALRHQPIPWGAVVSTVFYGTNYYQAFTGAESHYLSHCWSLAVEEQFYLIWPFLLVALLQRGHSPRVVLMVAIPLLWLYKALLIFGFGVGEVYLYRALETRMDQLAAGCLLAALLKTPRWRQYFEQLARQPWPLPALMVGLLLSTSLLRDQSSPANQQLYGFALETVMLCTLLPLVLIKAAGRGLGAALLNTPVLVLIGQISYGMYLYHPFIVHPIRNAVVRLGGPEALGVLAAITVLVALAWASFRWFEQPLRERLRPRSVNSGPSHLPHAGTHTPPTRPAPAEPSRPNPGT